MTKYLLIVILIVILCSYLFLCLCTELELKNAVERIGVSTNQLIDSSFKIRDFATTQLFLFILLFIYSLYCLIKRK